MAATKQLAAVTRSGTGKGAARHVRREARVPGVIYGGGEKPEPITVDFKDLNKHIYAGRFLTTIFELEIEGRKERVLPRDYQLDVVTDRPLHVDFLRLRAGSRVRTSIPLHVVNRESSPGVKKGGTVNIVYHSLELLVPADDIPESVELDIGALDFHDAVHVAELKLPPGCRATGKGTVTVVTIVPPSVLPDEPAAAAPATAAAPAKGGKAPAAAPAKGAAPAKAAAPAKPAGKK